MCPLPAPDDHIALVVLDFATSLCGCRSGFGMQMGQFFSQGV